MSGADVNKLILAALTTLLVALLIGNIVNELTHQEPLEENAYRVLPSEEAAPAAPEPASQPAAAPAPESIATLLASADPAAGKKAAKRCAGCHTFDKGGSNKTGPNLWGVVGRDKGSAAGFSYSDAIADAGGTWTYDDLNAFLTSPKAFVPGTKMGFIGIKSAEDRAAIIAYLREQSDSPQPLPGQ